MAVTPPEDDAPRFAPPEPMTTEGAPGQSPYLDHWRERAGLPRLAAPPDRGSVPILQALIDGAFAPPGDDEGSAPSPGPDRGPRAP